MATRWTAEDLKGVIAVAPTPAKEGAQDFRETMTVDLDETERMVKNLLRDGVHGLLTNGTLGEMATLTFEEWKAFAEVVYLTVRAHNPDFPLFIGATTLSTRDTIERMRFLRDLGVRGVFLGRPFWSELGPDAMIRYYRDVTAAFPEMSIVLYDNPEAFKGPIPTPVYRELAKNPRIIGAKYIALTPKYRADVEAVNGKIRLMPLDSDWLQAVALYPVEAQAFWSSSALCGPEPVLYLWKAVQEGRWDDARWVTQRIEWTYEPFLARQNFREFSKYNIPLEKIRFDEAGYVKAGPTRPPYHVVPEAYAEGARENGRRWRTLVEEVRRREKDAEKRKEVLK
ncbi:dihydrodipicolinate synthase family protein [Hydrogenibacillus schlegelii]|uniref:4-hydroxy-tetrahydrodipicolinate synthase n=1 Tax=Hydrogenibacillus schlegelii TaxID=1484 RepID=A0A132MGX1_HYDSH|nr:MULTISPECIES: dihydrodipicolinate synthase family protein [Hydrogenibacillus]KWW97015.1 aldolase [Hydrogenibacillus schlegelii]OAR05193.1 aldolase [Hydrogenibacillus schlegelii]PTQ51341.1 MAG: 4-hydroxy-tetrahydrodipicolinate synthase [Hydrogenibacillus schlegelii]QZA33829.1 dihydrodipicolinate synthase family protein [Hydrogenibacillus sp. N12]